MFIMEDSLFLFILQRTMWDISLVSLHQLELLEAIKALFREKGRL